MFSGFVLAFAHVLFLLSCLILITALLFAGGRWNMMIDGKEAQVDPKDPSPQTHWDFLTRLSVANLLLRCDHVAQMRACRLSGRTSVDAAVERRQGASACLPSGAVCLGKACRHRLWPTPLCGLTS